MEATIYCVHCGAKAPHELFLPVRAKKGLEYVAICRYCLGTSTYTDEKANQENVPYIKFFCSLGCGRHVRGKIVSSEEKEEFGRRYYEIKLACPICKREQPFIFSKT